VISELELNGHAIERVYERGRLVGLRLIEPEDTDTDARLADIGGLDGVDRGPLVHQLRLLRHRRQPRRRGNADLARVCVPLIISDDVDSRPTIREPDITGGSARRGLYVAATGHNPHVDADSGTHGHDAATPIPTSSPRECGSRLAALEDIIRSNAAAGRAKDLATLPELRPALERV
jgi:hypothetical protein